MCKILKNCSFYKIIIVILLVISSILSVVFIFCDPSYPNNTFIIILTLAFLVLIIYFANLQYKSEQNEKELYHEMFKKIINKNEEESLTKNNQDYRLKLLQWEKTHQIITALAQKTEKKNEEGDKITTHKINFEIMNDLGKAVEKLIEVFNQKNDE